jgi:hypothetical protein
LLRRDQIDAARRRLDRQTWELAWAEGRAMTTEQAIAQTLGGDSVHPTAPQMPDVAAREFSLYHPRLRDLRYPPITPEAY